MSEYRKPVSYTGSQRLFSATAAKTEKKNVSPRPSRGGIRL